MDTTSATAKIIENSLLGALLVVAIAGFWYILKLYIGSEGARRIDAENHGKSIQDIQKVQIEPVQAVAEVVRKLTEAINANTQAFIELKEVVLRRRNKSK